VETVIGLTKNFNAVHAKFTQSELLQELVIIIAYQLTAMRLRNFPLRVKRLELGFDNRTINLGPKQCS
jgi:hypothetical protein